MKNALERLAGFYLDGDDSLTWTWEDSDIVAVCRALRVALEFIEGEGEQYCGECSVPMRAEETSSRITAILRGEDDE